MILSVPMDNFPLYKERKKVSIQNTLKNNLICQHYYHTEDEFYTAIEEFAYVHYIMYVRILIIITRRIMRHATGLHEPCG